MFRRNSSLININLEYIQVVNVLLNNYYKIKICGIDTGLQPPMGVVFYSPLAGFSLLAYEVS